MTIKFTVQLSAATVRAFKEVEGATTGDDIKGLLVETLQAFITDTRDGADADDEE